MKKAVLILLFVSILAVSGCNNAASDVAVFNSETESTISLYENTLKVAKDHEEELVHGLFTGDITLPCVANLDTSAAMDLLQKNKDSMIEASAFIKASNYYTRLGQNSVTQVTDFLFQGTNYIMQVLWVDCKIDQLILEVK